MTCKYCGAETKWPEPYVKGALMINPDGSEHRCKGKTQTETTEALEKYAKPLPPPTLETKFPPQAKDFDEMQNQTLFDDGYSRAKRKISLLRGVRKALGNESEPVIGMIFNQICADLRSTV